MNDLLRKGKTNERCLFGSDHLWTALGDAMACGTCGRLDGETATVLGVDRDAVKVNLAAPAWLIFLREEVNGAAREAMRIALGAVGPDFEGDEDDADEVIASLQRQGWEMRRADQ